ncbi:MAG: hypothetical protein RSF82_02450 [Angelakisella sp.]
MKLGIKAIMGIVCAIVLLATVVIGFIAVRRNKDSFCEGCDGDDDLWDEEWDEEDWRVSEDSVEQTTI